MHIMITRDNINSPLNAALVAHRHHNHGYLLYIMTMLSTEFLHIHIILKLIRAISKSVEYTHKQ